MSAPFPLPIEDRLALMDAIARYNLLADQNDIEGYLELFADDGRLLMFVPWQPAPIVDVKGKTTLRAALHEVLSRREKPIKIFQTHPVIEGIDARTARTQTEFFGFWPRTQDEPPTLRLGAWYVDIWTKSGSRWLISERREQPASAPLAH
ncbi:nuclear transport factor 2 family protein [Sandaracinus amylolyticus]|uniref:nuclear transport factor 2 family protein n=1 Tax=Sandaracinus amylolyticus TaxID=927083 RepID=UPI001F37E148|nr:nuclear transport factor 2 family protein [Sandaracinus amylolyticus]UJR78344.1 Hypothetical protein I5071_3710 [Sandaracinus amylolyticus]